jgi:hypothetical protein
MQYTLIVAIAACLSLPILAAVLATLAITREERAWTLGRPAPGSLAALARRMLGFHADSVSWPQPRVNPVMQPSRCRGGKSRAARMRAGQQRTAPYSELPNLADIK